MKNIYIPRPCDGAAASRGVGKVFVEMSTEDEARAVLMVLKGRSFDQRTVDAKFFPMEHYSDSGPDYSYQPPRLIITTAGPLTIDRVNAPPRPAGVAPGGGMGLGLAAGAFGGLSMGMGAGMLGGYGTVGGVTLGGLQSGGIQMGE